MNEGDENKMSHGHKTTDYLGNWCFAILIVYWKLISVHCFLPRFQSQLALGNFKTIEEN